MKILTLLLSISLFTACNIKKETVESIYIKKSLNNYIILDMQTKIGVLVKLHFYN